jgi:hypothetical protein
MHAQVAVGAYVVTSEVFTKAAADFARDKSIWLQRSEEGSASFVSWTTLSWNRPRTR